MAHVATTRRVLYLACLVAVAAGLAACGDDAGAIPDDEPTLNVINASFETLVGEDRRVVFGVSDFENEPRTDAGLEIYLRSLEQEVVGGPYEAEFFGQDVVGAPTGLYLTYVDLEEPGPVELVAVDGDEYGAAALNVVAPEDSAVPAPGDPAIPVETPTFDDDLGVEQISTLSEPTTMHEHSLDDVLAEGRPAMVLFATPAFCQTAVCGPAVEALEEIHTSRDWGEVEFLHLEIFTDEGQTVAPWVQEWGLPTEPWLFAIDGDGMVVDRMDGAMIPSEMEAMAEELAAG